MSRASSTSAESDAFDDEGSEVKDAEQAANDKANVEHLDHTTRIAMRSGSVIPAKPSACRSTTPTTPASSSSPPTSPPPDAPMATSIPMPGLPNLTLHSPSATIVGTPFTLDTDIPRFEYPFPDTPIPGLYEYNNTSESSGSGRLAIPALPHSSSSGSSSDSTSTSCGSSAAPSPSHPTSSHYQHDPHHHQTNAHQHVHIPSRHATHPVHITHIPHPHPNHLISQSPPGSAFPLALTSTSTNSSHPHAHPQRHHHAHSNSNTHSSHQTQHHPLSPNASALLADSDREEPPVPPGLLKKRHRWSLGLLSTPQRRGGGGQREGEQRRSATVDHTRRGDKNAHNNNDGTAEYFDVSPGSCTSESSSCSAASDSLHALHISDSDTLQGSDIEPSKLEEEEKEEEKDTVAVDAVDVTTRSTLVM
ncbi:hypothetical protein PC9H_010086 [Pleurotus ostreatus]|uniref:Uncharacterized protein n=1 Tax=Pleurotus ostreatus TaxID=5322 RepID=A0A8H6ZUY9_PLEOS|nr:uncharacterized protein PC9H_010086 [Pleurotus ostreatus]KAF7424775.1 hypothetical protein PC9H_010086 [Pleurotus ostreatus]